MKSTDIWIRHIPITTTRNYIHVVHFNNYSINYVFNKWIVHTPTHNYCPFYTSSVKNRGNLFFTLLRVENDVTAQIVRHAKIKETKILKVAKLNGLKTSFKIMREYGIFSSNKEQPLLIQTVTDKSYKRLQKFNL